MNLFEELLTKKLNELNGKFQLKFRRIQLRKKVAKEKVEQQEEKHRKKMLKRQFFNDAPTGNYELITLRKKIEKKRIS